MRVKLEEKTLDDGRVRQIVMYRKHWWSSWKPFLNGDGDLIVNYGLLGEREEEGLDCARRILRYASFPSEEIQARLSMLEMIAWSENVYVGAKHNDEYSVAYDTPTCNVEDLQDLEIKEE